MEVSTIFSTCGTWHLTAQQVLNQRAALLSNYEVLTLLRELESDYLARTKTALRIKKEEEAAGNPPKHNTQPDEISENLRTVEVEVSLPPVAYNEGWRPTHHRHAHRPSSICLRPTSPPPLRVPRASRN